MFDTMRTLETLKTDADIAIYYHGQSSYSTKEWVVKLEKESDGTKLEIRVEAETLDEAVANLNSKFRKAIGEGLKELALPVLEYHPPAPQELEEMTVRAEQDLQSEMTVEQPQAYNETEDLIDPDGSQRANYEAGRSTRPSYPEDDEMPF